MHTVQKGKITPEPWSAGFSDGRHATATVSSGLHSLGQVHQGPLRTADLHRRVFLVPGGFQVLNLDELSGKGYHPAVPSLLLVERAPSSGFLALLLL